MHLLLSWHLLTFALLFGDSLIFISPFWWQSDVYLTFLVTPWYLSQDIFGIYKSLKIKPIRHPIVSDRISSQNEITCIGEILFTCPAHWLNESVTLSNLETEMFLKLSDYASQIGSAEHFWQKDKNTKKSEFNVVMPGQFCTSFIFFKKYFP